MLCGHYFSEKAQNLHTHTKIPVRGCAADSVKSNFGRNDTHEAAF